MFIAAFLSAIFAVSCVSARVTQTNVRLDPAVTSNLFQNALQCIRETNVDPALLAQIREKKFADDANIKNFFVCAFKKTGILSKKGSIKVDKMLDVYPDTVDKVALRKVIDDCNVQKGPDVSDNIYNFFKCYQDNTPVRVTISS